VIYKDNRQMRCECNLIFSFENSKNANGSNTLGVFFYLKIQRSFQRRFNEDRFFNEVWYFILKITLH